MVQLKAIHMCFNWRLLKFFALFVFANFAVMGSENRFELKFAYPEKLGLSDGEMLYDPRIEVGSPVRHVFRLVGRGVDARGLGYSYDLAIEETVFLETISKLKLLKDGEVIEIPHVVTLKRDGNTVRGVYLESLKVTGTTQEFSFDYKESLIFSKNVSNKLSWIKNTFSGKDEPSGKDKPKTRSSRDIKSEPAPRTVRHD